MSSNTGIGYESDIIFILLDKERAEPKITMNSDLFYKDLIKLDSWACFCNGVEFGIVLPHQSKTINITVGTGLAQDLNLMRLDRMDPNTAFVWFNLRDLEISWRD